MTFGCLPPDVGAAEFSEQLLLAHRYRNKLVEIDRARRNKFREIRAKHAPRLVETEAALEALNAKIDEALALSKQRGWLEQQIREAKRERDKLMVEAKRAQTIPFAPIEEANRSIESMLTRLAAANEAKAVVEALKAARKLLGAEAKEERARYLELLQPAHAEFRRRVDSHGKVGPRITERLNMTIRAAMLEEPEWSEAWKENARSEELFLEMAKKARAECGVSSGTYLLVESAMEASKKTALGDVRFVAYNGEGRIGVQLKHTSIAEIREGEGNFLRLKASAGPPRPGAAHRPDIYQRVWIRVAASADRKPVWAELPVKLHRPIPADAQIKWAWILVRRQGPRRIYSLQLTIESAVALVPVRCGDGSVAVNLGWRKTDRGLRVAYCMGSDGTEQSIECDAKSLELFGFCDSLRSISDLHFDATRAEVKRWRESLGRLAEPEWLNDALEFMSHWRSHRKLARVARNWVAEAIEPDLLRTLWSTWCTERISAKLDLFCPLKEFEEWAPVLALDSSERFALWLEWWRRKDDHLWSWEANERQHAIRRRKQAYRLAAIDLAKRYNTIVIDDTDLRKLADLGKAGGELPEVARHQRTMAAPSELKAQLLEVFGKDRLVKVPAKDNTALHAGCGGRMSEEPGMLHLRCTTCGAVADRDANNCENLLIRSGFSPKRRAG
jgi:hypothetical protein